MPKMRFEDDELDLDALEEAEYDPDQEDQFAPYDGPQPPVGTILPGYIRKIWLTRTSDEITPMLVILWIADDTAGKYEGCPFWERIAIQPNTKFKWYPFFDVLGLDIKTFKTKTIVSEDDENQGAPILKIGNWEPGEDSDEAYTRIVSGRHKYDGSWQMDIAKFLDYEAGLGGDADDEVEPEEPPARSRSRARASASTRSAANGGRRTRAAAADDEGDGEDEEPEPPARGGRRAAPARSRAGTKAPAKAAAGSRGRSRGKPASEDEPPF